MIRERSARNLREQSHELGCRPIPGVCTSAGHLASNCPGAAAPALAADPEHDRLAAGGLAATAFDDRFLQHRLLARAFRAVSRGVRVHRPFRRVVSRDVRIPVQHVLPVDLDHALLLDGNHHVYGSLSFPRRGVSADHSRQHRPDLRLQVCRIGGHLELGVLSAGIALDGGLRDHDQRAGCILCHVRDLPADVRVDRRQLGRDRRDRGCQRLSQAAEGSAGGWPLHNRRPVHRPGGSALANARRHADFRLAGQRSEPAGVLPEPALAEPVDVSRSARLGAW